MANTRYRPAAAPARPKRVRLSITEAHREQLQAIADKAALPLNVTLRFAVHYALAHADEAFPRQLAVPTAPPVE